MNRKTGNFVARIIGHAAGRVHKKGAEAHLTQALTDAQSGNFVMAASHANQMCALIEHGSAIPVDNVDRWQDDLSELFNAASEARDREAADAIMYQIAKSSSSIALSEPLSITENAFEWYDAVGYGVPRSYGHALHGALLSSRKSSRGQQFLLDSSSELVTIYHSTFDLEQRQLLARLIVQVNFEIRELAFSELQLTAQEHRLEENDAEVFVNAALNMNCYLDVLKHASTQRELLESAIQDLRALGVPHSELSDELVSITFSEDGIGRPNLHVIEGGLGEPLRMRHQRHELGREHSFRPRNPEAS